MDSKLILALDGLSALQAMPLVEAIGPRCNAVKIHSWYDHERADLIDLLKRRGARRVWVDYKLHDTPDTVGFRTAALVENGADIITVHASGGSKMMQAAVNAAGNTAKIWAITVLTSLTPEDVARIYGRSASDVVLDLALMANAAGVSGLVCSAQEVGMLSQRAALRTTAFAVPGTRSVGIALGQQARSGTPKQAVIDGATYLVAGSQVTKARDPVAAFEAMEAEIA